MLIVGLGDCELPGRSSIADVGRGLRLLEMRGMATLPAVWLVTVAEAELVPPHGEAEDGPSISAESITEPAFLLVDSSPLCFLLLRVQPFLLTTLGSTSSASKTAGGA